MIKPRRHKDTKKKEFHNLVPWCLRGENNSFNTTFLTSRQGLTLIEVVAGIVLLGTLLVTILMAFKAHATQIQAANQRLEAIRQTDRLLMTWMKAESLPGVGESDTFPNNPELRWEMVQSESEPLGRLQAEIMRLEVFSTTELQTERPLTSVELLTATQKK